MVLAAPGAETLTAQTIDRLLQELHPDAEQPLPEEDIIIIDELLRQNRGLTAVAIAAIEKLSIVDEQEIRKIRRLAGSTNPRADLVTADLSPAIAELIAVLLENEPFSSTDLLLRQLVVFSSDVRYLWRAKVDFGENSQGGLLLERDPGELAIADFAGGYWQGKAGDLDWIIGDHQIIAGYGLNLWRSNPGYKGFDTGKSAGRPGPGLQSYRSTHEAWALRGLALQWRGAGQKIVVSASRNRRHGTLPFPGYPDIDLVGLHRSAAGVYPPAGLMENAVCGVWEIGREKYTGGVTLAHSRWSDRGGSSTDFGSGSVFGSKSFGSLNMFGEIAHGFNASRGQLGGVSVRLRSALHYLLLIRKYDGGYTALRANPLTEWSGDLKNESGLFQSLNLHWGRNQLTCVGDIYRESAPAAKMLSVVSGSETALRWEWQSRRQKLRFQWKREKRSLENTINYANSGLANEELRQTVKIALNRDFSRHWKIRLQANLVDFQSGGNYSHGWGVDSRISWQTAAWSAELDQVLVKTDDYDSRIYFWDLNLPGEMRSRVYAASGYYPGLRLGYQTKNNYRIFARLRCLSPENRALSRDGFEGGLLIEANL
ncbi:MAG: hypothetical protein ABIA75_02080 [Candidatus Neomarinimicrobiota bacterium]